MTGTTNAAPARRSFLALLTGAVAATAATTAAVTPSKPVVGETPELLALGRRLDELFEAFRATVGRKDQAAEIWERTRPAVPDELIEAPRDRTLRVSTPEADIDGQSAGTRQLYWSKALRMHIIAMDIAGRSKEGRRLNRLVRLAKSYEKGIAEAYRVSGYEDCSHDVQVVVAQISTLAHDFLKVEPVTVEGLLIYGRLTSIIAGIFDLGVARIPMLAALGEHTAKAATRILSPTAI